MAANAAIVNQVYSRTMADVIEKIRQPFRDEGADEGALNALKEVRRTISLFTFARIFF